MRDLVIRITSGAASCHATTHRSRFHARLGATTLAPRSESCASGLVRRISCVNVANQIPRDIVGVPKPIVNSWHHQAVGRLGSRQRISVAVSVHIPTRHRRRFRQAVELLAKLVEAEIPD